MEILSNKNVISKLANDAYLMEIKVPTTKKMMIDIFRRLGFEIEEMLDYHDDLFDIGQVEILNLDNISIFVYKRDKDYYISLKDKDIKFFKINHKSKKYSLIYNGSEIKDISKIKEFIDNLADLKRAYPSILLYDLYTLYENTDLIDESNYKEVISDDEIVLMLPYFRDINDSWKHLSIVIRKTKEDVGYIEFNLSEDNFKYIGNVEYAIKEKFRSKGYATRGLALVKRLVAEYERVVDKILYITTEVDNFSSQGVILKNGGTLFYEGKVPKGDKACFLNKVDYVKIYTIDANTLQE